MWISRVPKVAGQFQLRNGFLARLYLIPSVGPSGTVVHDVDRAVNPLLADRTRWAELLRHRLGPVDGGQHRAGGPAVVG
jgi:hypothetical protein